jgi:hypothetical protein
MAQGDESDRRMAEISLGDVDLEAVLFRLTRHAQALFGLLDPWAWSRSM